MVAQLAGPSRPPANIEDFLWNLHSVLVTAPSPLSVDALKDTYSKQLGHKFAIERWLVMSEQGLAVTLKKIPHIVTQFQANGTTCLKASCDHSFTKEQLIEKDAQFRQELQRKNAAAKNAKAGGAAPPAAKAAGPTRPPAKIEDFLWNLHTVLEAAGPVQVDQLADTYSKQLGHKFFIERFLVVGESGVGSCLKKIPHIVTITADGGKQMLTCSLAKGSTKEQLIAADQNYRKALQARAQAKAAAPAAPAKPAALAPPAAGETRPSEGGGEPEAKKAKTDDAETLSKMLVQGVVRVLQQRAKEGKGALAISQLAEEFKTLWKVPFNLQTAGYTDVNTFLKAWPNKVEVTSEAGGDVVALAKKGAAAAVPVAAKAPAPVPKAVEPPAAAPAATAPVSPVADASPKAAEGEPDAKKPKTDTDTLSRMLVQGVVRVLQNRAKEEQGPLLVNNLAEEFKVLWKVPFNLQSAGYTDVNTFLKAWPNKVELTSTADGDVVSLAKKGAEKAAAAAPAPPAKAAPPPVPAVSAASLAGPTPTTDAVSAAKAPAASVAVPADDSAIPSTATEIQNELTRNAEELQGNAKRQRALVARQQALIEALTRVS